MKKQGWIMIAVTGAFICLLLGVFLGRAANKSYIQIHDIESSPTQPTESQPASSAQININTATVQHLQLLPGIGESLAQRIVTYRETNGNFTTVEELMNVSGIGEKKFADIKDFICVTESEE